MTILDQDLPYINIYRSIQDILQKRISPSYGSKLYDMSTRQTNSIGHCPSYVDNSIFINAPNYGGRCNYSSNSSEGNSEGGKDVFSVILMLLTFTTVLIMGIFTFFDDPYIKFKMSNLNRSFNRITNPEILSAYRDWKPRFLKRTWRKFMCKISIIASLLSTIIVAFYSVDHSIIPVIMFCASCIVFVVQYCLDVYNDKEVTAFINLVKQINLKCCKKDQ